MREASGDAADVRVDSAVNFLPETPVLLCFALNLSPGPDKTVVRSNPPFATCDKYPCCLEEVGAGDFPSAIFAVDATVIAASDAITRSVVFFGSERGL